MALTIIMPTFNLVVEFSYSKRIPFHSCLICNLVKGWPWSWKLWAFPGPQINSWQ